MLFDSHKVILAPMAGVTDRFFRQLCIEQGAQLTYTEMVSAKGLSYANEKTTHLINLAPNEQKVVVQLFGHEPDTMAAQARWVESTLGDKLFSVDINMGCPAKKIAGKGDGSALMRDFSLASNIITAVSHAISVPLTVKFRRGFEEGNEIAPEFARMAEAAGASAVAVHGRYAQQFYRGRADWDVVSRVKCSVDIPVIGNGDITCGKDAQRMIDETSCDAIMVGRAAEGDPWIFRDIRSVLETGKSSPEPTIEERMALALRHAELLASCEGKSIVRMRKHAMWYVGGLKEASALRRDITTSVTLDDFRAIFERALRLNEEH